MSMITFMINLIIKFWKFEQILLFIFLFGCTSLIVENRYWYALKVAESTCSGEAFYAFVADSMFCLLTLLEGPPGIYFFLSSVVKKRIIATVFIDWLKGIWFWIMILPTVTGI